ncbi:MAG TPA: hypothetical protein VHP58_04430 [Alphaproteobacteria bacterium]|nr:hypothetical protein [Alphaproteobacteria bacterium]
MFINLLNDLQRDTIPMQHDGMYALMSWRDISIHKQMKNSSGGEGWLLLLVFALWLPLLFLA